MDECITKHRAKHFVCEFCNEHFSDEPCEPSDCEWMNSIDKEPAIDPESLRPTGEWISIYDKMPKQGERVLATDGGFVGEMYINKRGQWQRYNVNDSSLMMALDILWWMPLPEPPNCGAKMKEAT